MAYVLRTLLLLCALGLFGPWHAWAQTCVAPKQPTCPVVAGAAGVYDIATDKCVYQPRCDNGQPPDANGACSSPALVCPSGTTGTAPNNCITTARACPSDAPDDGSGNCISSGGGTPGTILCPSPATFDTNTQKCLFPLGLASMAAFCPQGVSVYPVDTKQCVSYNPCPDGTYGAQCRYKPDSAAICNYADQNTPL